jgi:hypothetical protein
MENLVRKFCGCTRHFFTLERPHQKSFTRFGDGRTARLPDESDCLTKWYGQVKESNVCWAYAWQTFLESLQKFSTTLRSKKKCPWQFSDFSRHHRAFLHLFVGKWRKMYILNGKLGLKFAEMHKTYLCTFTSTPKKIHVISRWSYCTSTKKMSLSHKVTWTTLRDQCLLSSCMTNFFRITSKIFYNIKKQKVVSLPVFRFF